MKYIIRILPALLFAANTYAQDSLFNIDVLRAPSSPAAGFIGTAPSDVHSFTDPSAFMVSLQNATDNFSSLPKNYAVDIAPAWLFNAKNISYASYASASPCKSIPQSLLFSTAIKSTNDSAGKKTELGLSIKVSIFRGKFGTEHFKGVDSLFDLLSLALKDRIEYEKEYNKRVKMDSLRKRAAEYPTERDAITERMTALSIQRDSLYNKLLTSGEKAIYDSLKNIASRVSLRRYGFKTDIVIGTAFDFPDQVYANGYTSKAGAWVTAGWDDESGVSITTLYRYLYNPDKVFADDKGVLNQKDISTLDLGGKLQYENMDYKITVSAEAIYRSVINYSNVQPTWRYTINADYAFQKNMHLAFAIGRDYDATFNKDGNVIAALNVLFGLGNNKKLK